MDFEPDPEAVVPVSRIVLEESSELAVRAEALRAGLKARRVQVVLSCDLSEPVSARVRTCRALVVRPE